MSSISRKETALRSKERDLRSWMLNNLSEQQMNEVQVMLAGIVMELHKAIKMEVRKELIKAIESLN